METTKLTVAPTVAALYGLAGFDPVEEFSLSGAHGFATVYASVRTDGNPEWGMPLMTEVTAAAEVWRDGMDDDGDGEPVTDAAGLAALLGCEPAAVAVELEARAVDLWLSRKDD